MRLKLQAALFARRLYGPIAVLLSVAGSMTRAATPVLWTGPNTNFTQSASAKTDVLIAGAVSFTRGNNEVLFNPADGDSGPGANTPSDTLWAFGALSNYATLTYQSLGSLRNGDLAGRILGHPMVVHLVNQDIYLSVTFSAWGQHGAGGFAYARSTPAAVVPAPSVTITNPANGAVFAAPANVAIAAIASVAGGTLTNVAFFTNAIALGAVQTAPFSLTAPNLAAGTYALTAVATAAGISATSSVVTITVVSSTPSSITSPAIANNQFAFDYAAAPGLTYVVQNSTDLVNWLPVVTNVASGVLVHFTDVFNPNGAVYYRVGQLPNPQTP